MTREEEVPPEVSGFRRGPSPRARNRALLTPEAVGKAVALILADLARRVQRHPEMRPQTSTRKDKSTVHRTTHSPATARKGVIPREVQGGT